MTGALLRAPEALTLASERHRWGLAPFHYVDEYYRFIAAELGRYGCRLFEEPLELSRG